MGKSDWPKWTVVYNIPSPNDGFVGKGWEFFDDEAHAEHCYRKQIARGNVPTMRPFHPSDKQHMNPCDVHNSRDT